MLSRMGLLLRLGPNLITDGTFITLGSNYYTCAFYIALKHLLLKHDRKNKEDIILTDISPQISTH